jgi:hypothetical protein
MIHNVDPRYRIWPFFAAIHPSLLQSQDDEELRLGGKAIRSPTIDTDETQDESDDEMPPLMGVGSEAELSPAQRPAHRMDVDSIQE